MQPPPGYPQGPQDSGPQNYNPAPQQYPQGQQPYPQGPQPPYQQGPQQYGAPPQYGMQQYPYYPPQKKGMPGWAIALIVCVAILPVVGILGLAAIPLITSNTRDARRAEGEQLMGFARDYLRVEYSKSGDEQTAFQAFAMQSRTGAFDGKYYKVDPTAHKSSTMQYDAEVTCTSSSRSDGRGHHYFRWADGGTETKWD